MNTEPKKPQPQDPAPPQSPGGDRGDLEYRVLVALRTRAHPRWLEAVVVTFSRCGNWGLFWVGLALLIWLGGFEHGRGLFFLIVPVVYITLLVNYGIKTMLDRERPLSEEPRLRPLVGVPSSSSFPSSHAAMSFAAAVVLTFYLPYLWAVFLGLAFLMSWSRVYVGVHYPADVIAGTFTGLGMGTVLLFLLLVA